MKPLSNDLRERFVHAVLIEGMTCRAAGERFAVSHSAVIKIVRQFVETDAIDPQKVGGSIASVSTNCRTIFITAEWETAKRSPAARHVMPSIRTAWTNLSRRSFDSGFISFPVRRGILL